MINAVGYEKTTGRITHLLVMQDMDCARLSVNQQTHDVLEISDSESTTVGDNYYVQDSGLVERPAAQAHLVGQTLVGLTVGCKIRINSAEYTATSDAVELSFPLPGTYRIAVENFPEKTAKFEVIV